MASITEVAERFFEACETGKGWDACKEYCRSDATFSAQAEALAGIISRRFQAAIIENELFGAGALDENVAIIGAIAGFGENAGGVTAVEGEIGI